jgi:hypothetical protein
MFGGDATAGLGLNGRRNSLDLGVNYTDTPYYHLGVLGASGGVGGNPTLGFSTGRTWQAGSQAAWRHQWSRTTDMTASYRFGRYGYNTTQTTALVGQYFNESHTGSLELSKSIGQRWDVNSGVRRNVVRNHQGSAYRPTIDDTVHGGVNYTRNTSATRAFNIGARAGASRVYSNRSANLTPYTFWTPSFSASTGIDLGRTWSVHSDYRLAVSVPYALSVQQTPYVTHNVSGGVGGSLTERISIAGNTALTNGRTRTPSLTGNQATYRGYTVSGQMNFAISTSMSAMFSVSHVVTKMNILASQNFGVVPNLQRTQARVGLSWTLPLIGRGAGRGGT